MADDQQDTTGNGETPPTGETPTFDSWIEEQDEDVRGLIDSHTQGLRSALESERTQAKSLAKELKALSGKLDANSDAAKQLQAVQARLETEQARAEFYEEATAAGCRNLKLAWLAASTDDLSLAQVQKQYPDLFVASRPPATNAGNGAAAAPGPNKSMNDFIRQAAGYRS